MKINEIRPKFHFLTKKIEKQMTHLVFLFSVFTVSLLLEPFGSRLIDYSVLKIVNVSFLFFVKEWNLGRIFFSYILLLIQNLLDEQFVTNSHRAWATCVLGSR